MLLQVEGITAVIQTGMCSQRPACPAQGEQCRISRKIGHFARVCRGAKGDQQEAKVHYRGEKHDQIHKFFFQRKVIVNLYRNVRCRSKIKFLQSSFNGFNTRRKLYANNVNSDSFPSYVLCINQALIPNQSDTGSGITINIFPRGH